MISQKPVEVMLDSTLVSVDQAEEIALRFAGEAGFPEEEAHKVGMAVRESMVNAVLHGNHYDPGKKVGLRLELEQGRLVVTITDEGDGFDVDKVPNPLLEGNLLRKSGRGVFLIRAFVDELHVRRLEPQGAEVRMIKYLCGENGKEG